MNWHVWVCNYIFSHNFLDNMRWTFDCRLLHMFSCNRLTKCTSTLYFQAHIFLVFESWTNAKSVTIFFNQLVKNTTRPESRDQEKCCQVFFYSIWRLMPAPGVWMLNLQYNMSFFSKGSQLHFEHERFSFLLQNSFNSNYELKLI